MGISLFYWFELLQNNEDDDQEVIRLFCASLEKYHGTPTAADMAKFVDLFAALRMHQLQHGGRRTS